MATILIVDDNLDACQPLARLLRILGHNGVCVGGGAEALDYIGKSKPDAVILDIMMPGIDGWDVLKRLRDDPNTRDLPIIMFSALGDDATRSHAFDGGANDYWVKGMFDFQTLKHGIERVVSCGL